MQNMLLLFRSRAKEEMEEEERGSGGGGWAEMVPDALANIFSRLSLEDMLSAVPGVCRSWRCVSQDAVCWQKVDLEEWSCGRTPETLNRMAALLVTRSRGYLTHFCVPGLTTAHMLLDTATSELPLQVLRIPNSLLTEDCMCQLATKLSSITYLDISGCSSLSRTSLESFGKNCGLITRLNLNMWPQNANVASNDDLAFAVAEHMQQLKHLEMGYGMLSNTGLKALLDKCTNLEFLNLRGCCHVNTEESFVKEASKRLKVFYPPMVEDDSDDSDVYDSYFYDDLDEDMWYDYVLEGIYHTTLEEEMYDNPYIWTDMFPSP